MGFDMDINGWRFTHNGDSNSGDLLSNGKVSAPIKCLDAEGNISHVTLTEFYFF
jgi:hypothetical protein